MNSKERHFSFETNFERTTDEFRKNVIRSNDLPRKEAMSVFTIGRKKPNLNSLENVGATLTN
jgi:hypothetical protein